MSAVEVVPPPVPLNEECGDPPLPTPCYDPCLPDCPAPDTSDSQQPPERASLLAGFYALSLQVLLLYCPPWGEGGATFFYVVPPALLLGTFTVVFAHLNIFQIIKALLTYRVGEQ
jgi:hypothetical protein